MEKTDRHLQNVSGNLVLVAVLVSTVFQTWQLMEDRRQLSNLFAQQEKQMSEAKKMREQLDVLAVRTLLLATQGDVPAEIIVDFLRKQGINIQVPK